MSAILGTFVKIGTMADGTPRIVLDLQCKLQDIAAMGLIPGVPFALARLEKEAAVTPPAPEPKEKPGPLCIMACNFCEDPLFWKWAGEITRSGGPRSALDAREFVLSVCGIESRKELDMYDDIAHKFHTQIRNPFLGWKAAR